MKTNTIFFFILLASCNFMFSQVTQDSLSVNYIYAPNHFNDSFSAEESWEIHKTAYIKQLKSKGLTDDEIKRSMLTYEKDKEEFIARVKEQHKLAAIVREKAAEQRALAEIIRREADELRKEADSVRKNADEIRKQSDIVREQAAIQREKAEELRKQADNVRKNADEVRKQAEMVRKQAAIQRENADALRKQADIERAKADEQRKLADIRRSKAEEQRKKSQAWRNNAEDILIKNITLSNQSDNNEPISFKVASKTTLHIGIRAQISSGTTSIEIYNPKGVKEGEMSLNFKPKSGSNEENGGIEYTSGALDKTISRAEVGEWQIKVSSKKSEGTVAISVAQDIKSTMDE